MSARTDKIKDFFKRQVDPWAGRIADYSATGVLLVGIGLGTWATARALNKRFGTVFLTVGVVIVGLVIAVAVLVLMLRRECRLRPVSPSPEPSNPDSQGGMRSEAPVPPVEQPVPAPRPGAPDPPPRRPASSRSTVRSTPAFRAGFGDHAFGERLQQLYNKGADLEKGCPASVNLMRFTVDNFRPTDAIDVRAWANNVDAALAGRAALRSKFDAAGKAPWVWSSIHVAAFSSPLKEEMKRRLHALAAIIESL